MFIDEFGYSFAEDLATTWAPRGKTPILKRVGKFRREISTMVGLSITGKIYTQHFKGSIKGPQTVIGLEHVRRKVKGPMIVVWDRSRPHRSETVQAYLDQHPEIHIEELPSYAPKINPEEYCHGLVKKRLKNFNPDDVAQIQHCLDTEFDKLRKQRQTILGFFHHAGLSLNQLW